jgi:hypothetical protein
LWSGLIRMKTDALCREMKSLLIGNCVVCRPNPINGAVARPQRNKKVIHTVQCLVDTDTTTTTTIKLPLLLPLLLVLLLRLLLLLLLLLLIIVIYIN